MPNCLACGSTIDEYDSGYYARNMLCIPCYTAKASEVPMVSCARCGVRIKQLESREVGGGCYCNYCASEKKRVAGLPVCPFCKEKIEYYQKARQFASGKIFHEECAKKAGSQQETRDRLAVSVKKGEGGKTIMSSVLDRIGSMIG